MKLLGTRIFNDEDQHRFADFSGDFNPIHLDNSIAYRELFGEVIVHGIHSAIQILAFYAYYRKTHGQKPASIYRIRCSFLGPIFLKQRVKCYLIKENESSAILQSFADNRLVLEMDAEWLSEPVKKTALPEPPLRNTSHIPNRLDFVQLKEITGQEPVYLHKDFAKTEFPDIKSLCSDMVIASLLALSRIVGMRCPGYYSIFDSFDLCCKNQLLECRPDFTYKVVCADPRLSSVAMLAENPCCSASISTFFRPKTVTQTSMKEILTIVDKNEFSHQTALIIGGSGGIGEITAKIIAAGGGHSILTYKQSVTQANIVANEIRTEGGICGMEECDIQNPLRTFKKLAQNKITLTHIYFFASPKIFTVKNDFFKFQMFVEFCRFYTDGLYRTYKESRKFWQSNLCIFYPSTVAIDEKERNLSEYSAAKASGESLCNYLMKFDQNLRIVIRRLPRIATNQTISLIKVPSANATPIMMDIIRYCNNIFTTLPNS